MFLPDRSGCADNWMVGIASLMSVGTDSDSMRNSASCIHAVLLASPYYAKT